MSVERVRKVVLHHNDCAQIPIVTFEAAWMHFQAERFPEGVEKAGLVAFSTRPPGERHAGSTTVTFTSKA